MLVVNVASLRCESSGVRAPGEGVIVDVDAGFCVDIVSDDNVFYSDLFQEGKLFSNWCA